LPCYIIPVVYYCRAFRAGTLRRLPNLSISLRMAEIIYEPPEHLLAPNVGQQAPFSQNNSISQKLWGFELPLRYAWVGVSYHFFSGAVEQVSFAGGRRTDGDPGWDRADHPAACYVRLAAVRGW
jgi:hypothetical protein